MKTYLDMYYLSDILLWSSVFEHIHGKDHVLRIFFKKLENLLTIVLFK